MSEAYKKYKPKSYVDYSQMKEKHPVKEDNTGTSKNEYYDEMTTEDCFSTEVYKK